MGKIAVFHLRPPGAVSTEVTHQESNGSLSCWSLIRDLALDHLAQPWRTIPVLKTIERRGCVSACPSITPPSGCCISVSHSPINRACSIRSRRVPSRVRIPAASITFPVVSGYAGSQPCRSEKPFDDHDDQ